MFVWVWNDRRYPVRLLMHDEAHRVRVTGNSVSDLQVEPVLSTPFRTIYVVVANVIYLLGVEV